MSTPPTMKVPVVPDAPLLQINPALVEVSVSDATLRDLFAGQALAGATAFAGNAWLDHELSWDSDLCDRCYAIADAMLKARQAQREDTP